MAVYSFCLDPDTFPRLSVALHLIHFTVSCSQCMYILSFFCYTDMSLILQANKSSAECYNVLSPFFEKLRKWGSKFATLNLV